MFKQLVPLHLRVLLRQGPKDGLLRAAERLNGRPLPPPEMMRLVTSSASAKYFLESGKSCYRAIRLMLDEHGVKPTSVLDFGCGVGRILRHWPHNVSLHGTDYNAELIAWCQSHLPFASFEVNSLDGLLPYTDSSFDFIYAFSVFTHLPEPLQHHWMNELRRVLKPHGHLYFTTHSRFHVEALSAEQKATYNAGRLVVTSSAHAGTNTCAAYHPEAYVHRLVEGLTVAGQKGESAGGGSRHDEWLVRR